ncbi:MAG: hypothetical protein HYY30_07975 [Chloroflexi bacterium]|nr:hypothetical protein [Chloroflexota bacterium]
MPRIRFIRLTCGCDAEYKLRIERIGEGIPFECVSCGAHVEVQQYADLLERLHRYTELVLKLERMLVIEGDTVSPLSNRSTVKLVTW